MSCFTSFQSLLKDVFTATVQSEDEFTHLSATLAIACIFQLYTRAPRFALHQQRMASFNTPPVCGSSMGVSITPALPQPPSASEFANNGFFHTGRSDETVCVTCGLGLKDWRPTDQADAAHARFARELTGCISLPCLFLEVHRFLTSDLPLARKNLIGDNGATNCCLGLRRDPEVTEYVVNLAERLRAIALMMTSSNRAGSNWPVQNARELGYSDDLIALALWRLQSDAASTPVTPIPLAAMTIAPQSTTILLKSILRVQENGFGDDESDLSSTETEDDSSPFLTISRGDIDGDEAASSSDDIELQALSSRRQVVAIVEPMASSSVKARLPDLAHCLIWWFTRFPQSPVDLYYQNKLAVPARRKANSTSI